MQEGTEECDKGTDRRQQRERSTDGQKIGRTNTNKEVGRILSGNAALTPVLPETLFHYGEISLLGLKCILNVYFSSGEFLFCPGWLQASMSLLNCFGQKQFKKAANGPV